MVKFCIPWIFIQLKLRHLATGLRSEDCHINLSLSLFDYFSLWCMQKMNIVRIDPGTELLKLSILWTSPPCLRSSRLLACLPASSTGSLALHFDLWMWMLSNINILFWNISKWAFYSATGIKELAAQYCAFPSIARPPLKSRTLLVFIWPRQDNWCVVDFVFLCIVAFRCKLDS